jgi:RimJ/RimL family protein N-acetyltransferase
MTAEIWPLFGLELATERLRLRLPSQEEAARLASQAPDDLEIDPSWPAPDGVSRPVAAGVFQGYWRAIGTWRADHWRLPLGVWIGGELVGFQELEGEQFTRLRTVDSSSWLVPSARGRGIGKEMRAAVLTLAFDHLGAQVAITSAWDWNRPSLGVSRALGYVDNGWFTHDHLGTTGRQQRMVLERGAWDGSPWPTEVRGLETCLGWFGEAPS